MHDPEESEQVRAELAKWRGTKTAANWILVATIALIAAQTTMIAMGKERLGTLAAPSSGAIIAFIVLTLAKAKIRALRTLPRK